MIVVAESGFAVFDENSTFYGDSGNEFIDRFFLEYMETHRKGTRCLDIGGGSGRFAGAVLKRFPRHRVTVVDPSPVMLEGITSPEVEKVQGHLPDNLNVASRYDYVSVNDVLHHVCGSTEDESMELAVRSLIEIRKVLAPDGVLFLHELFYESYVREDLTRALIFRWLRAQNRLGLRMPVKELRPGLMVNFYTRAELRDMIQRSGYRVVAYDEFSWSEPRIKKRLLFLRDWGDAFFVLKAAEMPEGRGSADR